MIDWYKMAQKNKKNYSSYKKRNQGKPQTKSRGHVKPEKIYSLNEANDRLYDIFRNHDYEDFPHDKRMQLARFYQLLLEEQKNQNFTRLVNLRDIAIKHFIDCLMVAKVKDLQFPLMDVGTGPGFPGIPLKILFPEEQIFLAEGVGKRVSFLKHVREELELPKLGIFGRNINDAFVYPVRSVITRAVEEINNTLRNVFHCLQTGGEVYFMKGPRATEELERLDSELMEYYELTHDIDYQLPKTQHARRLVVFKKIKPAPLKELSYFIEPEWAKDDGKDY